VRVGNIETKEHPSCGFCQSGHGCSMNTSQMILNAPTIFAATDGSVQIPALDEDTCGPREFDLAVECQRQGSLFQKSWCGKTIYLLDNGKEPIRFAHHRGGRLLRLVRRWRLVRV